MSSKKSSHDRIPAAASAPPPSALCGGTSPGEFLPKPTTASHGCCCPTKTSPPLPSPTSTPFLSHRPTTPALLPDGQNTGGAARLPRKYSLVGIPPLPPPCINELLPELYLFFHSPFQDGESFRIPLSPKFYPRCIVQLSCSPQSSYSYSNKGAAFPPNFVAVGTNASSGCMIGALHYPIFYKGELYCISRKREINTLDFSDHNINAISRRIVVPAKEDNVEPVYRRGMPVGVIHRCLVES